jgi:MOSC domain-containing protein YiiM
MHPDVLTIDGYRYSTHDARATITNLGAWWDQLAAGRACPPAFDDLAERQAALLAEALHEPLPDDDHRRNISVLGRSAYAAIGDGRLDPERVLALSLDLVHEASSVLRAAGAMPETALGRLDQINVSDGGVPKRPVATASVDRGGVAGDRQAARQHHGRPWQAVCLWSAEVIDDLATAGHPIGYGACGENLTVRGLPWAEVRSGVRLAIGPVLLEASLFSLPCTKNAQWFLDGDFQRIHHERGPVSRIYATVLEAGAIATGDVVVLEP